MVFTGTLRVRNGGTILAKNGDLGWYFDFSDFIDPGHYYTYDLTNEVGSYGFDIESTAYNPLMYHASRFYYYLRCNFAKSAPFADNRWQDSSGTNGLLLKLGADNYNNTLSPHSADEHSRTMFRNVLLLL